MESKCSVFSHSTNVHVLSLIDNGYELSGWGNNIFLKSDDKHILFMYPICDKIANHTYLKGMVSINKLIKVKYKLCLRNWNSQNQYPALDSCNICIAIYIRSVCAELRKVIMRASSCSVEPLHSNFI